MSEHSPWVRLLSICLTPTSQAHRRNMGTNRHMHTLTHTTRPLYKCEPQSDTRWLQNHPNVHI